MWFGSLYQVAGVSWLDFRPGYAAAPGCDESDIGWSGIAVSR